MFNKKLLVVLLAIGSHVHAGKKSHVTRRKFMIIPGTSVGNTGRREGAFEQEPEDQQRKARAYRRGNNNSKKQQEKFSQRRARKSQSFKNVYATKGEAEVKKTAVVKAQKPTQQFDSKAASKERLVPLGNGGSKKKKKTCAWRKPADAQRSGTVNN